jgi:hypothetical protein
LAEHIAASNPIRLSLQIGHLRLQVGLLLKQSCFLCLKIGYSRLEVGYSRLEVGYSRLEADFGLLNICQLPLGFRQLGFELGRGALRTGQLGPEKTYFEGEEFVFHP